MIELNDLIHGYDNSPEDFNLCFEQLKAKLQAYQGLSNEDLANLERDGEIEKTIKTVDTLLDHMIDKYTCLDSNEVLSLKQEFILLNKKATKCLR